METRTPRGGPPPTPSPVVHMFRSVRGLKLSRLCVAASLEEDRDAMEAVLVILRNRDNKVSIAVGYEQGRDVFPTHIAAETGNPHTLEVLLAAGFAVDALDPYDQSIEDIARHKLMVSGFAGAQRFYDVIDVIQAWRNPSSRAALETRLHHLLDGTGEERHHAPGLITPTAIDTTSKHVAYKAGPYCCGSSQRNDPKHSCLASIQRGLHASRDGSATSSARPSSSTMKPTVSLINRIGLECVQESDDQSPGLHSPPIRAIYMQEEAMPAKPHFSLGQVPSNRTSTKEETMPARGTHLSVPPPVKPAAPRYSSHTLQPAHGSLHSLQTGHGSNRGVSHTVHSSEAIVHSASQALKPKPDAIQPSHQSARERRPTHGSMQMLSANEPADQIDKLLKRPPVTRPAYNAAIITRPTSMGGDKTSLLKPHRSTLSGVPTEAQGKGWWQKKRCVIQ